MKGFYETIFKATGLAPELQAKIFISVIILISALVIRWLLLWLVWKKSDDIKTRYFWKKSLTYIFAIIVLISLIRVWFTGLKGIATFLGLLSAGLAIALKDIIANIAGWVFILVRRPFALGDRIQLGSSAGDVIDIRLFQFTLMEIGNWIDADQSTGRVIHIPNGKVFSESLANYSKGFKYIWNEIPVLVTFESDWKKAKEILNNIVHKDAEHLSQTAQKEVMEVSKKYMILYSTLTPTVYTSVRDSGVLLTLRYLCQPRQRRSSEQVIWEDILLEFSRHKDIDFAYPTQRYYHHLQEGNQ